MGKQDNEKQKLARKPNHEFKVSVSEDGQFWIFKSIETWILPSKYIETIYKNKTNADCGAKTAEVERDGN